MSTGVTNMKDIKIFETLLSKKGQLQLATQVVKMILKIDDVIEPQQWYVLLCKYKNLILS